MVFCRICTGPIIRDVRISRAVDGYCYSLQASEAWLSCMCMFGCLWLVLRAGVTRYFPDHQVYSEADVTIGESRYKTMDFDVRKCAVNGSELAVRVRSYKSVLVHAPH